MKKGIYLVLSLFLISFNAEANNMLVQNVTTLGNDAVNKTIQVQFDISWDNSWRDDINYDAAWIFMKFKAANGLWQHVQLNPTGFVNGTGTANTVQVTNDKVGCWLYRTGLGSGTFNSTGMQLQWNYGLAGLSNVTGLEVRVFAVEMVYVPEGEFNCAKRFNNSTSESYLGTDFYRKFTAPGDNLPVINNKLSPPLNYNDGLVNTTFRIKGDVGIDFDNNGSIDNTQFPIGYKAFYCFKYSVTEQQYADFLNTLTSAQITTLGIAGTNITLVGGTYFTSTPNKGCGQANVTRLLSFSDWLGLRPLTVLEFNKASYGPLQPVYREDISVVNPVYKRMKGYPAWGSSTNGGCDFGVGNTIGNVGSFANSGSTRIQSGASYYGVLDLTGNTHEPIIKPNSSFSNSNGNGLLLVNGINDVNGWSNSSMVDFVDMTCIGTNNSSIYDSWGIFSASKYGFRYCRSAE